MKKSWLVALCIIIWAKSIAQKKIEKENIPKWATTNTTAFSFRSLGPATTSGRIVDLVVNPNNPAEIYLALASSGVWKTTNNGTTWNPIFDKQNSYSTGCIAIDPNNSNIIWLGSGENNNQRSVAYGDGIYLSLDGGKSWKNVGLKESEHIGMIAIDPNNSNHVYVAAYGPLWRAGGDRGIYETKNGGESWSRILEVSEHTGFNEIHMDPRDPNTLYATAHQRRRHVYTYLSGGPESAMYKSDDGGVNWITLQNGLPKGDIGRIGMDISPANPDVLYATIEGHGFYKSNNRGASWSKQGPHETSGNYYVELIAHPKKVNTVYSMDTYAHISKDGGKSFNNIPKKFKHVDNHCLWIDPNNTQHMLMGTDGGLYETWDEMKTWNWRTNLPTIQFYRVAVDNSEPFYNIYGGTQDNNSLGGPSQTINRRGIINSDWLVTNGGDGFESAIDPENQQIVYAQAQYGWLVRFNKETGEKTPIQPQPRYKEEPYRWNWDAPLIASKHTPKTLYFAANKVFKSTDRGDSWSHISKDLSRQIDRNELPIMNQFWGPEAIALHKSTSIYGNIVTLKEHPKHPKELWAGTDDGLVWKTTNDGQSWTQIKAPTNLPKLELNSESLPLIYVQDIVLSSHDDKLIYLAYNNHKNGDFKPYIFKSVDGGDNWINISDKLPERGSIYSLAEDHEEKNLLFVGTEFGLWFTLDGGKNWAQLKSGLPTIAIKDIAIQERENDLVLATFGRGFYILDNYAPLRELDKMVDEKIGLFKTKKALLFPRANVGGIDYKGGQQYSAKNPKMGITFYLHFNDSFARVKDNRPKADKKAPHYPSVEQLREEDWEEKPYLLFVVKDTSGQEVSRFTSDVRKGIKKIVWDGKYSSIANINTKDEPKTKAWNTSFVKPGDYQLSVYLSVNGNLDLIIANHNFEVQHLYPHHTINYQFINAVDMVYAKANAVESEYKKLDNKLSQLRAGFRNTVGASIEDLNKTREIDQMLKEIAVLIFGDKTKSKREIESAPSLKSKAGLLAWGTWNHRGTPTGTMKILLEDLKAMTNDALLALEKVNTKIKLLEKNAVQQGVPYWD